MKILQVCPRYPPQTGGVETHVREISERLVERGHAVTVHTADAREGGDRRGRRTGVEVRRHHGFAPSGAFHVAPGIAIAVRRADADIVHAHNYHSLALLFAAFGARDARFVVTPHYHGASANWFRDRLLAAYRPLGRRALRRADGVVAVSEWERSQLAGEFGVEPTVVPNGIDVERFESIEPELRDGPYLLTVGRLEEYKGVQHAIRALPELPEYELVVVGEGHYHRRLARLARGSGVAHRVSFLGHVKERRLPRLYAGADAYLALSAFESYGLTVGEALAAGTPCVVRSTGALTDWTNHEGVVGTDLDPNSIRMAIATATRQETIRIDLPDWSAVVDRLEAIYAG